MTADFPPVNDSPWRDLWSLDPQITFLNHGSFGACPIAVLKQQQIVRQQLEAEPLRFFEDAYEPLLDRSRLALSKRIGASPEELAFVSNATTGINTVLRSLSFRAGDELLTTNHEYNACRNALDFVAATWGAKVVVAEIPFPLDSDESFGASSAEQMTQQISEQMTAAVMARLTERTRLVLVDHVTSQTGLIFPIRSLAQQLRALGIDLLVDGAHAPGMVPLNLKELGVTYYTGNCHKWLCAPKGAAFLYVRAEKQSLIRPLVISHGANSVRTDRSRFHLEFDWTGTADPTPYCCVADAIEFFNSLVPQGWNGVMAHNHQMVIQARQILCDALRVSSPCPESLLGSMASIPLPKGFAPELQRQLFDRFGIEVPLIPWQTYSGQNKSQYGDRLVRISAQLYNSLADYHRLAEALLTLLAEANRSSVQLAQGIDLEN
ncbi:aminotransferase class V-fold PLP-dependent enzyme [Leptolyngbya ohadii]|uniref:aminotransferase class V-fold PLP-dependent enzyme n=1 Tax=Leptolyngbya ohadii TaxID=1962290 RepID=UPI000B5A1F9E|nr:aminotransferase class V-fold PLP-dependent enzyme [Leptolyngbya ohadii]